MPMQANPYRAQSGPYDSLNQGMNNLASVFMNSQPDPAKMAQAEAYAWRGRESRENVMDSQDARQGRFNIGDVFTQGYDPNADMGTVMGQGLGTGAFDVGDLGQLLQIGNANFGGTDEQVARSIVGANGPLGENDFVSLPDREMGRSRNAANDRALKSTAMSLDQQLGNAFGSGQMTLEDIYSAQHPNRYASAAETRAKMNGTAGGEVDWLDATRRATVEEQMNEAVDNLVSDLGLEPGNVPAELRTQVLEQGMQGVASGDFESPRQAAGQLWQQFVQGTREEGGMFGFGGEDVLDYNLAPTAQPRPTPAQGGTGGGDRTLQDAADAVGAGADPAAVRERLYQMGYTDNQLSGAGL